ncbi:hypothetical protein G5I_03468 [Acromyrmex echinatior]|uniref:Uncharacterized protein n=1 Tax=Acromyrmex echinatior TaxID=103372 RepID=F4WD24_ACREC|nr:hypothetical protein G5I_03468 [Acromyrmex echinatior]
MATRNIDIILNQLGWQDGFRIPIANEENKCLEEENWRFFKVSLQNKYGYQIIFSEVDNIDIFYTLVLSFLECFPTTLDYTAEDDSNSEFPLHCSLNCRVVTIEYTSQPFAFFTSFNVYKSLIVVTFFHTNYSHCNQAFGHAVWDHPVFPLQSMVISTQSRSAIHKRWYSHGEPLFETVLDIKDLGFYLIY